MIDFGISDKKQQELIERMQHLHIAEHDLQERFIRSSGPGGQHVNKLATCVQLRHIPSGIEIKMQKARTQLLNRYYARKRLCELIEEQTPGMKSPQSSKADKIRKQKKRRSRRSKSAIQPPKPEDATDDTDSPQE